MQSLDLTLATPAQNLALDEALLDAAEAGWIGEVLRFWESPTPFVVLGYGNDSGAEADLPACAAAGVPVLRRISGGGTVVQGSGCLNYALVLRADAPPLHTIPATNRHIMERNRTALQTLLTGRVAVQGHTDLTHNGLKFSGNSQRRRRQFVLFHGTFLTGLDLPLIERCLRMPTHQPTYRHGKAHLEFVANIPADATAIRQALRREWQADCTLVNPPLGTVEELVVEKYSRPDWNLRS